MLNNRIKILGAVILLCTVLDTRVTHGQVRSLSANYSRALQAGASVERGGRFKGQVLKGKRNGMGVGLQKNGLLYAGDYVQGKANGYALIISPNAEYIANCEGCVAYVGEVKNGMKEGTGICYDEFGMVMYHGLFASDKPAGEYPSYDTLSDRLFDMVKYPDGDVYVGEMSFSRDPDGYGTLIYAGGDLFLGRFRDGVPRGVGAYFYAYGEWSLVNFKKDGDVVEVSSSIEYASIDQRRKAVLHTMLMQAFSELASTTGKLAGQVAELNAPPRHDTEVVGEAHSGTGGGSKGCKSCGFYEQQYRREEDFVRTAYSGMTAGNGYSVKDKEGNDRHGKTNGTWSMATHTTNNKNLKSGQRRMQKTRQQARKCGCAIAESNYETVYVNY